MLRVVHLLASRFYGGPERQVLELARSLPGWCESVFILFQEAGHCHAFLGQLRSSGFPAVALRHDTPRLMGALRELASFLRNVRASLLCCHGYKANLLGLMAARWVRIPVIAVSRGWTCESLRVRLYEAVDRRVLRWVDRVVCVSQSQAEKVRRSGVPEKKIDVIRNAIRVERFSSRMEEYGNRLRSLFPEPPCRIVGAAGRLSPEKGFSVLVDAAARLVRDRPGVGFVVFGEGVMREGLAKQIRARGLNGNFVLPGFQPDLERYLPHLDVWVLPSFTEGLPNVALEASAAGLPLVATAVGGNPEVVDEGINGYLVPPGDWHTLARRIADVLDNEQVAGEMGRQARKRVEERFSFAAQAEQYLRLFERVRRSSGGAT